MSVVFEVAPSCTGGKVFKNCNHQVGINYVIIVSIHSHYTIMLYII